MGAVPMFDQWWFLLCLGVTIGAIGTLIGAGGGFILVPVLLLMTPGAPPERITAVSLAVVFCNAVSGTAAYLRLKRVDLKSAAWFALATLPGALVGALTTQFVPRRQFNIGFGVLMLLGSLYLLLRPEPKRDASAEPSENHTTRRITDREGTEHVYSFSLSVGLGLSVIVGFVSSLIGIGGGIIHVPVLNHTLNFPVHIATATSQATLCFMALAGTLVHLATGNLDGQLVTVGWLSLGAIVGAQIGARVSRLLKGSWIIRCLAIALGCVGLRILALGIQ